VPRIGGEGAPGIAVLSPDAGMFCLRDVRATDISAGEFARGLYAAHGVSLLDAGAFGASARGFLRLSFATSEALLDEGCRRIVAFARECAGRR
jgi:arginine:pyruvate transaminase